MIKILKELSQILAAAGVSASQEEQILIAVKNLYASREVIQEEKFDEQYHMEAKEPNPKFDEERSLEPEIEESLACPLPDLVCIQETNHQKEEDLHGMIEEDI